MSQPDQEARPAEPTTPESSASPTPATATVTVPPGSDQSSGTVTTAPARPAPTRKRPKAQRRNARVVIRKVSPWTVFKVSLIFYLCVMAVLLGAGVILYGLLGAVGLLDSFEKLADQLGFGPGFTIHGPWLFTRGIAYGLGLVLVGSIINVFVAFLYNLISDLVGGIEVTLAERR